MSISSSPAYDRLLSELSGMGFSSSDCASTISLFLDPSAAAVSHMATLDHCINFLFSPLEERARMIAGVASLEGMGFTPRRRIVEAMQAAKGNEQAAMERLWKQDEIKEKTKENKPIIVAANGAAPVVAAAAAAPSSLPAKRIASSESIDGASRQSSYVPAEMVNRSPASIVGTSSSASSAAAAGGGVRLYAHALETIFSFCDLRTLSRCMAVSADWLSGVLSMPSLHTSIQIDEQKTLGACTASRLSRHVSRMLSPLTSYQQQRHMQPQEMVIRLNRSSEALQHHMTSLESVSLALSSIRATIACLNTLPYLRRVTLHVSNDRNNPGGIQEIIDTISEKLSGIEEIHLRLDPLRGSVRFTSWASLSRLRALALRGFDSSSSEGTFSDAQIEDLRALQGLQSIKLEGINSSLLGRLLRVPHQLQLQSILVEDGLDGEVDEEDDIDPTIVIDDDAAIALKSLPSLTTLSVSLACSNATFLSQLTNLRELKISGRVSARGESVLHPRFDLTQLISSLQQCHSLTSLKLIGFPVTTDQLHELLLELPQLMRLHLCALASSVDSLAFFSTITNLAKNIKDVEITRCDGIKFEQLTHLHALTKLERLKIKWNAELAMNDEGEGEGEGDMPQGLRQSFTPPTAIFPNMKSFEAFGDDD